MSTQHATTTRTRMTPNSCACSAAAVTTAARRPHRSCGLINRNQLKVPASQATSERARRRRCRLAHARTIRVCVPLKPHSLALTSHTRTNQTLASCAVPAPRCRPRWRYARRRRRAFRVSRKLNKGRGRAPAHQPQQKPRKNMCRNVSAGRRVHLLTLATCNAYPCTLPHNRKFTLAAT